MKKTDNEERIEATEKVKKLSENTKVQLSATWRKKGFIITNDDEFITAYIANMSGFSSGFGMIITIILLIVCCYTLYTVFFN